MILKQKIEKIYTYNIGLKEALLKIGGGNGLFFLKIK